MLSREGLLPQQALYLAVFPRCNILTLWLCEKAFCDVTWSFHPLSFPPRLCEKTFRDVAFRKRALHVPQTRLTLRHDCFQRRPSNAFPAKEPHSQTSPTFPAKEPYILAPKKSYNPRTQALHFCTLTCKFPQHGQRKSAGKEGAWRLACLDGWRHPSGDVCDMTHSCVTGLIHVWHDAFTCDMMHTCVTWRMKTGLPLWTMRPVRFSRQKSPISRNIPANQPFISQYGPNHLARKALCSAVTVYFLYGPSEPAGVSGPRV